jgi:SLAP domain-containing protein
VRNGTDKNIYDIEGEIEILDPTGEEVIASAFFTFPKDNFGVLEPGKSRFWSLTYGPEFVLDDQADLTKYLIRQSSTYYY